ncbi:hypothetical protein NQD34_018010 [Periophthalmus magnuspinnatus]|nr:hypothetical protein NQD34_018010 [Periophthalmus magnuspinnatus]
MMLKRTLPLYVLFLCVTGDAPRGFCDDTMCCALFLESTTSAVAETRCQDRGGELYDMRLWGGLPALRLPDIHIWIKTAQNSGAMCLARGSSQVNRTCTGTVDGFLCQYTHTCKSLLTREGEYVNYTNVLGFEGQSSYLPGTLAVVRVSDHPPVSKLICTGEQWMRAPWSCEVMNGGCEHECIEPQTCSCPLQQTLHPNHFSCAEDPCAKCTHECVEQGGEWACRCREGFRLGPEGRCVDVDECSEDRTLCSGEGETCENEEGKYKCTCQDEYDLVDGVCVDSSICFECEHYCDEVQGAFSCVCRKGFRVNPLDPTKCEEFCSEQDCPAICMSPLDQCYCPDGYIQDVRDKETVCTDIDECEDSACDHFCYNTFGGFRCECEEGFQLRGISTTVNPPSPFRSSVRHTPHSPPSSPQHSHPT